MQWITLFLASCLTFCVIVKAKEDSYLGEFPWTVSLKLVGLFGHDCGGAILNNVSLSLFGFKNKLYLDIDSFQSWVLTTAYCAQLNDEFDHPNFEVIAGILDRNNDESGQIRHVEKAYVHPYFSSDQGSDIALLKLDFPLEFNENVTAVNMAVDAEALESTFMDCTESGWSKEDKHPIMQKSPLILIDTEVCQEGASDGDKVPTTSFCAGNESGATEMCPGYIGSPVTCMENDQPVLVGLQSFTWECNAANTPGIYTSIRSLRNWVEYTLEKEE